MSRTELAGLRSQTRRDIKTRTIITAMNKNAERSLFYGRKNNMKFLIEETPNDAKMESEILSGQMGQLHIVLRILP